MSKNRAPWPADPVDAVKEALRRRGWGQASLDAHVGGDARTSELLSRKRKMSLRQIRALHKVLGVPAEILIRDYHTADAALAASKKALNNE